MEPPQAHAFYVLAPVALVFAAFCWSFVDAPQTRRLAAAIRLKQPEMFAHRRAFAIDGGPPALADPSRPYDPRHDIVVIDPRYQVGLARSTNWDLTVRNDNPRVAFRDLLYITTYRDQAGRVVEERHELIKD